MQLVVGQAAHLDGLRAVDAARGAQEATRGEGAHLGEVAREAADHLHTVSGEGTAATLAVEVRIEEGIRALILAQMAMEAAVL
mmetsp:Transcript_128613/g.222912  ORF Transcript_128613/g.222912 Transcript_128613/m.222912 type:complete len:83 (-) Transcript_128613:1776-2024(-)